MSAHLAIPATTTILRQLIEDQLKKPYTGMTAPKVLAIPPPRPPQPAGNNAAPAEDTALYLYLHHVAANPAWRNMLDPSIDAGGQRTGRPPLVLDLHYVLAATGMTLDREALLGLGMTALHRNPIVAKAKIATVLGGIAVPAHPKNLGEIVGSEKLGDPASQPEQLTITLEPLDVDMSTKIWSALQAPIRPCAYYLVTCVFLESDPPIPDGPLTETVDVTVDAADGFDEPADLLERAIVSPVP
jgi:hypothetical protein